jgi:dTDP-4-dehydrorhamnose 3,5-epimerase
MIKKFTDDRGDFVIFDAQQCDQVNIVTNPHKYTFRGMHYQEGRSFAQRKTVKVIQGTVIDILYNLETKETEFYTLTKDSEPLVIGKEFAHGYLTIEPNTIFTYAVSGQYNPESEHSIVWKDIKKVFELIATLVPVNELVISDKDKNGK